MITLENWPYLKEQESESDDGSYCEIGDTFLDLCVNGSKENNDEVYDPSLMEEAGKYNFELEGKFEEIDTSNKPSPPLNIYDGVGLALKHGVATSFQTAM